ncbi:MAG: HNH endonuclease [Clostridium sp.]|uniref:HNH endonuclease n=1 Tax=Clostridium sp. TaxID=1506 RepID=UPI0025C17A78|nr:HNH endonuclease [Clostridium sp.]MCF0149504.1 HNH endonuclease [Clostridium sp.]
MFADGNKLNLNIENLILVTRNQLLIMNKRKLRKDSIELTKVGLNIAKVYERIGERRKKSEGRR